MVELLDLELAAPVVEIEARIADRVWGDNPRTIDPHLLTQARNDLESAGQVLRVESATRGGSSVTLLLPNPTPRGKTRATEDAAARKRLLFARWRSWSRGTEHMPNLIGAGGESVIHQSLLGAAPYGYRLVQPRRGEVSTLYGQPVPGGALDNAAWLTPMNQETQTPTRTTYLVPIEVKNVRHWLYPNHWEIYQLLHKSAGLANAHPEFPVLPMLICRKAHYRTLQLAKDLGFLVFQTHNQYVQPSERIRADHFEEVRLELGLEDLLMTDQANPALVEWLSGAPHREAGTYSGRWMEFSRHEVATFAQLRDKRLRWRPRVAYLEGLHAAVVEAYGEAGSWAVSDDLSILDD
ncbi:hypothetical protein [Kribbella sp. NPDC004536]|uniref:hypothetical protein n=1 Tax=Kribbella sp. NPDC004536 TaxID=3364106 RepID=UPI00368B28D8